MSEGMPTAVMGRTGIEVSRLGYGTWEIEGRIEGNPISRPVSEKHVSTMLNTALDSGMSIIDTADCYGHAEEFIGRSVSHRRDEFVIATKCGCHWRGRSRSTPPKQFTRESVFKNIDRSLGRLKTDHVDFLQLHNPKSAQVEDAELIDALLEVKRQGKTRWIGMSSDMPQLPPLAAFEELDVFQVGYQPMQRESEEWIRRLGDDGRGIIIRSAGGEGPAPLRGHAGLQPGAHRQRPGHVGQLRKGESGRAVMGQWGQPDRVHAAVHDQPSAGAHGGGGHAEPGAHGGERPGGPARAAVAGHAVGGEPPAGGPGLQGGVVDSG